MLVHLIRNHRMIAAGKHTPIILSRSPKPNESKAEVRVVDYSNHSSLVSALEGIHTVIVTLYTFNAKEAVGSQLALLEAAKEVGVKRFAPSEWASRVRLIISNFLRRGTRTLIVLTAWYDASE